ncbi:MAG: AarF/ABC1/UbiB kinase family protein [Desulfobacterales bacterium]|nr:AarF/ABC1/UbiB kinase family protein [Desulfobacterales bacterium]
MISIRKIGVIGRTYRHLNRYRHILAVLFKYGFDDVVDSLKIDQYLEVGLKLIPKDHRPKLEKFSRAERTRMAIEELGPTYIKLGQLLSTRPDLIPVEFMNELTKLQDKVPATSFPEIKAVVEAEFGRSIENVFDDFEETPLAAASIGQVHRARLKDGESVAIKVQRPGIQKTIEVDLEIMLHLATLIERHVEEFAFHRPVKIFEAFANRLEKEIDYKIEAANMDRFARYEINDGTVYVPKVFHEFSTPRVLTMEYVDGIKVSDFEKLDAAKLDRCLVNSRGANLVLRQIFEYGFFHADPHPGNIFVLPNNVICLIDFGMVGIVDRFTRETFVELIESIVRQDEIKAAQVVLKLTFHEEEPDLRLLERELSEFMGQHLYKPLKQIEIGNVLRHLLELSSRHGLRVPPDIFLMMKALGTLEGIARQLDPDFNMVAAVTPFLEKIKLQRMNPKRIASDIMRTSTELFHFLNVFPKEILDITRMIRQQKIKFIVENPGLEKTLATHDQISNRIAFSVIIAALIIGSALIVISEIPPLVYGISLIGIIVFIAAAMMGIWLLIAIIRKGRL